MLLGIGLFLVGSVLCGLAWSMPALIAFRAVQGLGAGAVQPMAITIAGDIYTVAERATAQGYIASVWAISSVVGPTLGGVFSQLGLWRWIFLVNVPAVPAGRCAHPAELPRDRAAPRAPHRLPRRRAAHHRHDAAHPRRARGRPGLGVGLAVSIAVFVGGAALLVAFVFAERRAAEPVLPLWVFSRRLLATTTFLALGVGVILIGLTSYVPTYLENALGVSPLVAGLALAALTLGLAAGRQPVRPAVLPAARLPPDRPHRARARRRRHRRRWRCSPTGPRWRSSRSPASSRAWAWASSRRRR